MLQLSTVGCEKGFKTAYTGHRAMIIIKNCRSSIGDIIPISSVVSFR